MELQSIVRGLPSCVLKKIKAQEILNDGRALKAISKRMRKAQLKALLQGVSHSRAGPSRHIAQIRRILFPKPLERVTF